MQSGNIIPYRSSLGPRNGHGPLNPDATPNSIGIMIAGHPCRLRSRSSFSMARCGMPYTGLGSRYSISRTRINQVSRPCRTTLLPIQPHPRPLLRLCLPLPHRKLLTPFRHLRKPLLSPTNTTSNNPHISPRFPTPTTLIPHLLRAIDVRDEMCIAAFAE